MSLWSDISEGKDLGQTSPTSCKEAPLLLEIQIMILNAAFDAVRVDNPTKLWSGERPGDIALRWFCYRESRLHTYILLLTSH